MRCVLTILATFVALASSEAEPLGGRSAGEEFAPPPLRPSIDPETDAATATTDGRRVEQALPSERRLQGHEDGRERARSAPEPARPPTTFVVSPSEGQIFSSLANSAPFLALPTGEEALWRGAGSLLQQPFQYAEEIAPPAFSLYDLFRRQDPDRWRQRSLWPFRSGWELEFAPARGTMFYIRDYVSPATLKTLAETKFGLAIADGALIGFPQSGFFYVGPFAAIDGFSWNGASRFGAHLTFAEIGFFQLTFAAGLAHQGFVGSGLFGMIEASWRF